MSEIKKYLQEADRLNKRIAMKLTQIQSIRDMVTSITPNLSAEPSGGGSQDKLGNAVAKLIDLENELNEEVERMSEEQKSIIELVDAIRDPQELEILDKRYLRGMSLESISCDMGLSYRTITYRHGKALLSAEKILKEKKKWR